VTTEDVMRKAIEDTYLLGIRDALQMAIKTWNDGEVRFGDAWTVPVPLFLETLLHSYQETLDEKRREQ
jgi:hypothetical protein